MKLNSYLLGMVTIVALFILGYILGRAWYYKDAVAQPAPKVWCEAGYINSKGELIYSQDHEGSTDFLVLATSNGPKLMVKCE